MSAIELTHQFPNQEGYKWFAQTLMSKFIGEFIAPHVLQGIPKFECKKGLFTANLGFHKELSQEVLDKITKGWDRYIQVYYNRLGLFN